jgi:hypothetical protein
MSSSAPSLPQETEALAEQNERLLAAVTELFPRWREDIQEKFVLAVGILARAQTDEVRNLRDALKKLLLMARTTGGTAGPDVGLMAACELAESVLAAAPQPPKEQS